MRGWLQVLLLAAATLPAVAHEARQDVRVEMAAVKVPGLVVELHQDFIAPQLVVRNDTGQVLEILDDRGRAYLRIGPKDAQGDVAAAAFHAARGTGGADVRRATLSDTPRWRQLARAPAFGWFDPHVATEALVVPYAVKALDEAAPFGEWRVPARLGGKPLALRGVFVHVPPAQGWVQTRLTSSASPAPGVQVAVTGGAAPAVFVNNLGAEAVTVLDAGGKPFLHIGPKAVLADMESPAWRAAQPPGTAAKPGRGWQAVAQGSSFVWLEPRATWRGRPPGKAQAAGVVGEWTLPLRIGSQPLAVRGQHYWQPVSRAAVPRRSGAAG